MLKSKIFVKKVKEKFGFFVVFRYFCRHKNKKQ